MSQIVIIGGGQAGGAAALALRRHGATGPITLIGREPLPPYERPALSKGLLLGETPFDRLVVLSEAVAAEQAITLRLGTRTSPRSPRRKGRTASRPGTTSSCK